MIVHVVVKCCKCGKREKDKLDTDTEGWRIKVDGTIHAAEEFCGMRTIEGKNYCADCRRIYNKG